MQEVTDPAVLGLDTSAIEALLAEAEQQRAGAGLVSCQLAVARHGRLGVFATLGAAAADSSYAIYSVSKPLLAAACWQLQGRGLIDPGARVAHYIPEFAERGKEQVRVEHLLTHTAGFPNAVMGPPEWFDREQRLRRLCDWRLEWAPGSRCVYHPTSSYWVLAEILERVSGIDYREYILRQVTGPLGTTGFRLGVPEGEQGDINTVGSVGEVASPEELRECFGDTGQAPENPDHKLLILMNDPAVRALGVPGGGGVGNAADVALFYQALLHNTGELWEPAILADATGRIRAAQPDPYTGIPANRSLGLIIQGDDGYAARRGMGSTRTSPRSFGHHGAGGQVAWADPVSGLSFCFLTDSLDRNAVRVARRGPLLSDFAAACAQ